MYIYKVFFIIIKQLIKEENFLDEILKSATNKNASQLNTNNKVC